MYVYLLFSFIFATLLYCYSTVLLLYCTATLLYYTATILLLYSTILLLYCTATLLYCYSTVLLLYCTATLFILFSKSTPKILLNTHTHTVFISRMDANTNHMIAAIDHSIMTDVIKRFDPRPETGIMITLQMTAELLFIKTIPSPVELGILLKYGFRQAALDTGNNWHRSPLHLACDGNQINSHEETILMLLDQHGASTTGRDIHKRLPLDLLWMDKTFPNSPSATQTREEYIFERRQETLLDTQQKMERVELEISAERRHKVLLECVNAMETMSPHLWDITIKASVLRNKLHKWEEYLDYDTRNLFYAKEPINPLRGDLHTEQRWFDYPPQAQALFQKALGISYLRLMESDLLRVFHPWKMYRCRRTLITYWFNVLTHSVQFKTPKNCSLKELFRDNNLTCIRRLGFTNEWAEYILPCADQSSPEDLENDPRQHEINWGKKNRAKAAQALDFKRAKLKRMGASRNKVDEKGVLTEVETERVRGADGVFGYCLYRNNSGYLNDEIFLWERPVDAIEIPVSLKFCSAVRTHRKASTQLYYTCEECNRKWSQVSGGKNPASRLCEACVHRCHKGHRGIKQVREGRILCMCEEVSKAIQCACVASTPDARQIALQRLGVEEREEWDRQSARDRISPPILAPVPDHGPKGEPRRRGGWMICRRPPTKGLFSIGNIDREQDGESVSLSLADSDVVTLSTVLTDARTVSVGGGAEGETQELGSDSNDNTDEDDNDDDDDDDDNDDDDDDSLSDISDAERNRVNPGQVDSKGVSEERVPAMQVDGFAAAAASLSGSGSGSGSGCEQPNESEEDRLTRERQEAEEASTVLAQY